MKKSKKVFIVIFLIVAVLGILAYWQRDNLKILLQTGQYTTQELETQMEENQQRLQEMIGSYPDISIREPTEEESRALQSGAITPEELAETLAGARETDDPKDTFSSDLSALIARVLLLQKLYVGKLEGLEAEAKEEYLAMPGSQRTKMKLIEWASGFISRATEMEKQCDAQMDEIVGEMLILIQENGGDEEIANKVIESYAEEKRLKKAWYLSRLEEGGLLG